MRANVYCGNLLWQSSLTLPVPQANIQLADALEKANCAPILVRMLREEPVFSGNH